MTLYDIWVPGDPKGQPRPRAFSRGGHARVYDPGTAEGWKGQIALAFPNVILKYTEGPVSAQLTFAFPRPKAHVRANGELKPDAPEWHTSKPDADNLAKAVLDCLTTMGVWEDDTQVARLVVTKNYTTPHGPTGCRIHITTLEA